MCFARTHIQRRDIDFNSLVSEKTQNHAKQNGKISARTEFKGPCHKSRTAKKNRDVKYSCENNYNEVKIDAHVTKRRKIDKKVAGMKTTYRQA